MLLTCPSLVAELVSVLLPLADLLDISTSLQRITAGARGSRRAFFIFFTIVKIRVYSVTMARNLLKNPNGDDQLDFWELTEIGGNLWKVEEMPGDCGHEFGNEEVTKYFATSFELCLKRQVIDLLEAGYSQEQLDNQPPVTVEDWFCGRTDCGCIYQMTSCLLDENHQVLQEYKHAPETLDPGEDCSWKQVNHTFSDYGPGMRFISFEHGGQDTSFWDGWFGVRVTGSSVTLV